MPRIEPNGEGARVAPQMGQSCWEPGAPCGDQPGPGTQHTQLRHTQPGCSLPLQGPTHHRGPRSLVHTTQALQEIPQPFLPTQALTLSAPWPPTAHPKEGEEVGLQHDVQNLPLHC